MKRRGRRSRGTGSKARRVLGLLLAGGSLLLACGDRPVDDTGADTKDHGKAVGARLKDRLADKERLWTPPQVRAGRWPSLRPLRTGRAALTPRALGEGFLVFLPVLPDKGGSPQDLFERLVRPMLEDLGFAEKQLEDSFWIPDERNVTLPEPDLDAMLRWICRSPEVDENPLDRRLCDVYTQRSSAASGDDSGGDDPLAAWVQAMHGEGLDQGLAQKWRDLTKPETELFFGQGVRQVEVAAGQIVPWVPIEHAGVFAVGRQGEMFQTLQGRIYPQYEIVNQVILTAQQAIDYSLDDDLGDGNCLLQDGEPSRSDLLLLPMGAAEEVPTLHFAYRLQTPVSQCWIDAEHGTTLFDEPLIAEAASPEEVLLQVEAEVYHRSPASAKTRPTPMYVDAAEDGFYGLHLDGTMTLVPPPGIEAFAGDAAAAPADVTASEDVTAPVCIGTADDSEAWRFLQVDLFATLQRQIETVRAAGLFDSFPDPPLQVELVADEYKAEVKGSAMRFGFDPEAQGEGCPDIEGLRLGASQDHSVVAHELGHLISRHLTSNRPVDWCHSPAAAGESEVAPGRPPCPVPNPLELQIFHDHADTWANTLEGTPCWGDWVGRNLAGPGVGQACQEPAEDAGSMPRLATVGLPFVAQQPRNHFPEGRCDTEIPGQLCGDSADSSFRGPYGDGQIAATALWQLRQGLAGRQPIVGRLQFLVRLVRTLRHVGWDGWQCGAELDSVDRACDQEIYAGLSELEFQLARQWAEALSRGPSQRPGAEMLNEVTAAFAKVGIFLIPAALLVTPLDAEVSPRVGDAVIDAFMPDEPSPAVPEALRPFLASGDHLLVDGPPPAFHVWTGPRYLLQEDGQAWLRDGLDGAPCNRCFQVEVATDAAFRDALVASPWTAVDTDPTNRRQAQCYGQWRLPEAQWRALSAQGERLYYRVTTHTPRGDDCSVGDQPESKRQSTRPGQGLWHVPAPSVRLHRLSAGLASLKSP